MAFITPNELQITYVTFFARPADLSGYEYWVNQGKIAALTAISTSDEAKRMYEGKGKASVIDQIYQNLLGRDSDTEGNLYWSSQLIKDAEDNFTNLAEVALNIATAAINNPNINPVTGKLDSRAIQHKISAAQQFTKGLYNNSTAAKNYLHNQQTGKDLLIGISADSTPDTVTAAVNAAIADTSQGRTSDVSTEFTFNNVSNATLSDKVNIGFTPEKTYLSAANDKIIIESFDSLKGANITIVDPSGNDNDILTISLSAENANWFGSIIGFPDFGDVRIKNIETIHIDITGDVKSVGNYAIFEGLKVLEIAGNITNSLDVYDFGAEKVDASGITSGNVVLNAIGTVATELIGGAGNDELHISPEGGTLTGNAGKDKFVVYASRDKLVTVTDIAKGDSIDFNVGTIAINFNNNKAKELPINGYSDESSFVRALQQAANKESPHGLYYAEFNENTYLVANGETGKTIKGSMASMSIKATTQATNVTASMNPSATTEILADDFAKLIFAGDLTIIDVGITGTLVSDGTVVTDNFSVSSGKSLTGSVQVYDQTNNGNALYSLAVLSGTPTVTLDPSGITASDIIRINGIDYPLSSFESLSFSNGAIAGMITFPVNGASIENDTTIIGGSTQVTGITLTGGNTAYITGVTVDGILKGSDDAMKDDIIVKLTGSHNLDTEATINGYGLAFV